MGQVEVADGDSNLGRVGERDLVGLVKVGEVGRADERLDKHDGGVCRVWLESVWLNGKGNVDVEDSEGGVGMSLPGFRVDFRESGALECEEGGLGFVRVR